MTKDDDYLVSAELAKEKLISELEKIFKRAWLSVDPLHPPGQPGSYVRGQYNGMIEMLKRLQQDCQLIRNTDLTDCQQTADGEIRPNSDLGNNPSATLSGAHLPALPMQKALTVVILRDDGAEEADACLAKLDKGGAFIVTKSEMFFHQLRLRTAEKPELLEKIDVFYLKPDGTYQRCGLRYEDELRWPENFMMEAMGDPNEDYCHTPRHTTSASTWN